jgi:hypothetical protein
LATYRPSCEGRHEGVVPILDPPDPPILSHVWDVCGQGGTGVQRGRRDAAGSRRRESGLHESAGEGRGPNPVWGPERVPPTTSYRARCTTASGLADRLPDRVGMRGGTPRSGGSQRGSVGIAGEPTRDPGWEGGTERSGGMLLTSPGAEADRVAPRGVELGIVDRERVARTRGVLDGVRAIAGAHPIPADQAGAIGMSPAHGSVTTADRGSRARGLTWRRRSPRRRWCG